MESSGFLPGFDMPTTEEELAGLRGFGERTPVNVVVMTGPDGPQDPLDGDPDAGGRGDGGPDGSGDGGHN